MGLIDTITRLRALLTPENLEYLDRVLTMLTDARSRTYAVLWEDFKRTYAGNNAEARATYAWNKLRELLAVVRAQREGK